VGIRGIGGIACSDFADLHDILKEKEKEKEKERERDEKSASISKFRGFERSFKDYSI